MTLSIADEMDRIVSAIDEAGKLIDSQCAKASELLLSKIATDRNGRRFRIDRVKVYQGGMAWRLYVEGPRLKATGEPHARTRDSSPLGLLTKIATGEPADDTKR